MNPFRFCGTDFFMHSLSILPKHHYTLTKTCNNILQLLVNNLCLSSY